MLDFNTVITSRQNPTVKRICALDEKKNRYAEGLFRFDGIKLFREALESGLCIQKVVVREDIPEQMKAEICKEAEKRKMAKELFLVVSSAVFEKMTEERSPEGIITVAKFPSVKHRRLNGDDAAEYSLSKNAKILLVQSLRDAGNMGTVIRSSAALGIDRLVISDDCADLYNSKTLRAAMGGIFKLDIDILPETRFADAIASLRQAGRKIYAAALHTEALTVGEIDLSEGDAFVIGNEGHGLSEDVIAACDACAVIPMIEGSESLNAAAAAAICIWETVRSTKRDI